MCQVHCSAPIILSYKPICPLKELATSFNVILQILYFRIQLTLKLPRNFFNPIPIEMSEDPHAPPIFFKLCRKEKKNIPSHTTNTFQVSIAVTMYCVSLKEGQRWAISNEQNCCLMVLKSSRCTTKGLVNGKDFSTVASHPGRTKTDQERNKGETIPSFIEPPPQQGH